MSGKEIITTLIFTATILFSSCSSTKRISRDNDSMSLNYDSKRMLKEVVDLNISSKDFKMDRVRVSASFDGDNYRFSGNMKYSGSGKLLFSARTIGGIEIARIYLDRNELITVDRINRIYSVGSTDNWLRKYGLVWEDILILFGDLPGSVKKEGRLSCVNGRTSFELVRPGQKVDIALDCDERKIEEIKVLDINNGVTLNAVFSNIIESSGVKYFSEVRFFDSNGKLDVAIVYEKYGLFEGEIKKPSAPSSYEKAVLK